MTVMELELKKAELARNILNQNSEDVINRLTKLYKNLTNSYPCQHSEQEILQSGYDAIEAFEQGKLIPHDEIAESIQ